MYGVLRVSQKNEREYCIAPSFSLVDFGLPMLAMGAHRFHRNASISPALWMKMDIGNGAAQSVIPHTSHSHSPIRGHIYIMVARRRFCCVACRRRCRCHPTATDNKGKSLPLPSPLLLPSSSSSSPSPSSSAQQSRRKKVIKIRNMFLLFLFYSGNFPAFIFLYSLFFAKNKMFIKMISLGR